MTHIIAATIYFTGLLVVHRMQRAHDIDVELQWMCRGY